MRRSIVTAILAALLFAACEGAAAQRAGFILFGSDHEQLKTDDPETDGEAKSDEIPANHRFVHPISAPYFHENSFVTSDVRAWFLYHKFPQTGLVQGGRALVGALQIRLALTERLQFVAYKDGFTDMDGGIAPLEAEGRNDVAAGLKYKFLESWEHQFHAAAGVGYEASIGSRNILHDDEEYRAWLSVDKGFGPFHVGGTLNYFWAPEKRATSPNDFGNSDRLSWHAHVDYRMNDFFSPVFEMSGYYVVSEGKVVVPVQGLDVVNLGGVRKNHVINGAIGAEIRPPIGDLDIAFRGAYEFPFTHRPDLMGWRLTFSAVISF